MVTPLHSLLNTRTFQSPVTHPQGALIYFLIQVHKIHVQMLEAFQVFTSGHVFC